MSTENKNVNELTQEKLVERITKAVNIPEDGNIHITITNQKQELPEPLPPFNYQGIKHFLQSVPAMATLLQRKGSSVNSIVYFNDSNINAILDQTIMDREFDTAIYSFEKSPQAIEWRNVFDKAMGQRDFIKFLKAREPGEIPDIEALLAAAQKITANFKVITESNYIDSNNLGIVYKIEDQNGQTVDEGKMTLPNKLIVTMPLLKESPHDFAVDIDLELTKPVDGKPPFFVLSCPRWATFWRQAVEEAVEDLRKELPNYLIVAGEGFETN